MPALEIEAKFRIPDEETLVRLLEVPVLAGYALGPACLAELHDRYLDTAHGAFLTAGLALRLRHESDRTLVTLKGLGQATAGVHRRVEHEVELPSPAKPDQWPPGPVREMTLQICGNEPLEHLFSLDQQRQTRRMSEGERAVAELSGDRVRVRACGGTAAGATEGSAQGEESVWQHAFAAAADSSGDQICDSYLELEVELLPGGTEQDLARISGELKANWRLQPVAESKFHRAVALVSTDWCTQDVEGHLVPQLTPHERACLRWLAQERAVLSRRARLLLAWDEGASVAEMLTRSGLSPRRARFWRQAFRRRRMGIFPSRAVESCMRPGASPPPSVADLAPLENPASPTEPFSQIPAAVGAAGAPKRPGVRADDLMSEAGRKVMRFHFERMLLHEPGTRKGDDIEELHDMRVATRRMRAAFRVFGGYLEPRVAGPLVRALRRTGRALGEVRDLDVFAEKTHAYQRNLSEAQRRELGAFMMALHAQRDAARERLISYLDSAAYGRFVTKFARFAESPTVGNPPGGLPDGPPEPRLVRHVAPTAVMERMAAVRAFEGWVGAPDTPFSRYHALRIAAKRLRYALEFFLEVLGPECKSLVRKTVALQDHLGNLQDGVVASSILRDFLVWGTWEDGSDAKKRQVSPGPIIAPGVALYLASRQSELQELLGGFPAVWAQITEPDFAREVAAAVGVL